MYVKLSVSSSNVKYSSGRSEADFVSFINSKTGSKRLLGGALTDDVEELAAHSLYAAYPFLHFSPPRLAVLLPLTPSLPSSLTR